MTIGKALGLLLSLSFALPLGLPGQTLDPKLAPLEALLDKDWRGLMKAPDGSAEWEVIQREVILATQKHRELDQRKGGTGHGK